MRTNKTYGILIIAFIYLFAIMLGLGIYQWLPFRQSQPLLTFLIIDVACTIWIYIFSLLFRNASIYDPYWSVAPMVIIVAFAAVRHVFNPYTWMMIAVFLVWGIRLTINWGYTFRGLRYQDWRYDLLKTKHPKLWPLISFGGIHLLPTLFVFIGMIPAFLFMETFRGAVAVNLTIVFAMIVCVIGIFIEMIADIQIHNFRSISSNNGLVMDKGLWKNSRHPNYLGEIIFWVGIFLMAICVKPNMFILIFCPLCIFLMFAFISVPLMEKRQLQNKAEYQAYKNQTNMFLIYPPKENSPK